MRHSTVIAVFFACILLSPVTVLASEEYTRERAEKLHHLIEWREYGPDAFEEALNQEKPIYLLISAPAWCYWCHVYESEDYLFNPSLYPIINEQFIPIFVDSDKRPDLTRKYLEGGWPSSTFFTPGLQRINGYSGPRPVPTLVQYFTEMVTFVKENGPYSIVGGLSYTAQDPVIPTTSQIDKIEQQFISYSLDRYDVYFGGYGPGDAPPDSNSQKFPKPNIYAVLLESDDATGLSQVTQTFNELYTSIDELSTRYHLYDPVEGGFHRYATKRDWSVPHFEKMLSDQAKFIRALTIYVSKTGDEKGQEMLNGTLSFIQEKFFFEDGGFASSQDAHLEGHFFYEPADVRAGMEQPYIDPTRTTDGTSRMVVALLEHAQAFPEDGRSSAMARKSLGFLAEHMVGRNGAFTYLLDGERDATLTGQSLSNAWALLAFVQGYEQFGEEDYLKEAVQLADYSLDNLYDWNHGGFFERNSIDVEAYAPNERIDLTKPYEPNAVFARAMLQLYVQTEDVRYLDAGLKTLGYVFSQSSWSDDTYHAFQATRILEQHDLRKQYDEQAASIATAVSEGKASFFVNDLLLKQEQGINLDDAPVLQDDLFDAGFILLLIVAFLAGILSFLSPCTLPVLSAFTAQGLASRKGKVFSDSLLFFLGLALVFSLFGMGSAALGNLFREHRLMITQIAGVLIILFGVSYLFGKGFVGIRYTGRLRQDAIGKFLFGMLFGIGWSACIGPVLASLLLIASTTGTIMKGTSLLFIYALGLALPLLLLARILDRKKGRLLKWLQGKELSVYIDEKRLSFHTTELIIGVILIVLGVLIFQDKLFSLNQFALGSSYVQNFILVGEEWLKGLFL